jgi:hypothetical protein
MNHSSEQTFSQAQVKHISYFSEEYIKQVLMESTSDKLTQVKAFVGSIVYPGSLFPTAASNIVTTQFAQTTYIGLMEFILADSVAPLDPLNSNYPSYTVLQIELDGVDRTFLQIAGGDVVNGVGQKFSDFVKSLYPTGNDPLPVNPSAIHILRNIRISGNSFNLVAGNWVATGFLSGSHTLGYGFCISVSGYSAVIQ